MVGSKLYQNLNPSSELYISEKPTGTQVDIDHNSGTQTKKEIKKPVWGQK